MRALTGMERSDERLLRATAEGDGDAFAAFFRRHEAAVTRFCVRRCETPDDVADAVADTFLVALRRARSYEAVLPSAAPWLLGVAQRVVARQARGHRRRLRLTGRVAAAASPYTDAEAERVMAAIDAARRCDQLRAALGSLPRGERKVLELVAYGELTPAEAAAALQITPNAARLRLARARRRLAGEDQTELEVARARA
jgi:RNA polymerase sigma factor (sigma-70 family)